MEPSPRKPSWSRVAVLLFLGCAGGMIAHSVLQNGSSAPTSQPTSAGDRPVKTETATFAAGCFWGVQAAFDTVPGVVKTTVGYSGGHTVNPTYEDVCGHGTGHAESAEVAFDPTRISFEKLVEFFFVMHDPTTVNRQGPDVGTQYRSAIFFHSPEQQRIAQAVKDRLDKSGKFGPKPIATEITAASTFYEAEEYHQKYFKKSGNAGCHFVAYPTNPTSQP
jgi:methionine-S-sulfoxide reductase